MDIVLRATVIYFFLWGLTRALGKRELSQMNPFDLVLLVVIGDLVQQGVTAEDMSITGAVLAVGTMACWVLLFSYIAWRWSGTRRQLEGLPVVVARDGELLEEVMAFERLPSDEVFQAARQQGIDDFTQVRYAILEPGGGLSFIRAE